MKVITLIPRRPDITRAAFKDYYESHHAPLGTRYFPFEKYVRNHLISSVPEDVGFDCLMECWLDREKAVASLTGEVGQIFTDDEGRFMKAPPRPEGFDAVEHLAKGPPRRVDPRGVRKLAWFLAASGLDKETFLRRAIRWGETLATDVKAARAIVDEVSPGHASPIFKGDAILTLWVEPVMAIPPTRPPAGIAIQAALALDSQETPTEELKANFGQR